jgi:hypothetical protein
MHVSFHNFVARFTKRVTIRVAFEILRRHNFATKRTLYRFFARHLQRATTVTATATLVDVRYSGRVKVLSTSPMGDAATDATSDDSSKT